MHFFLTSTGYIAISNDINLVPALEEEAEAFSEYPFLLPIIFLICAHQEVIFCSSNKMFVLIIQDTFTDWVSFFRLNCIHNSGLKLESNWEEKFHAVLSKKELPFQQVV